MNPENQQWQETKENYLKQIEKSLAQVHHPQRADILANVREHLDNKYAELYPEQQNWESYQQIITEMGPPEEYAELLCVKPLMHHTELGIWHRFIINAALSIGIIATIIILTQVVDWLATPYYGRQVAINEPAKPGEFAVKTMETLQGRYVDNTKYPFVNDPEVIGKWVTVDFVQKPDDFTPGQKRWRGNLWFKGIEFLKGGTTNWAWQWTKGLLLHTGHDHTASRYTVKTIDGRQFMFFEWKSGDYIILHRKPSYYVLVKADSTQKEAL
jgi:hypothetical protein